MNRRLISLFWIFAYLLMACDSNEARQEELLSEQTVFMYMPWATNLLPYFSVNIQDMETAIAQRGLRKERVLVFLAETATQASLLELVYQPQAAPNRKVTRRTIKTYSFSATQPEYTTAEGLTAILAEVKQQAPAMRYGMIIGCHGMGWVPATSAHLVATTRSAPLSVDPWRKAGEQALPMTRYFGGLSQPYYAEVGSLVEALKRTRLRMEYILFDDCYMTGAEVAYDLRTVADYLIGSPCEIMDYGMPYHKIGRHLLGRVDYEGVVNAFYAFYATYGGTPHGTISVTKLSEMEHLASLMRDMHQRFTFDPAKRELLQRLDGYTPSLFYDLGDYVAKLCPDPTLRAAFEAQLAKTVPYKRHTSMYYTMFHTPHTIPIHTFSGLTISAPSLHRVAQQAYHELAWTQYLSLP